MRGALGIGLWVLVATTAGCSPGAATSDAGSDAPSDVAATDATMATDASGGTDGGGDTVDATGTRLCTNPIARTTAFAATMFGQGTFTAAGDAGSVQASFTLDAYFPMGRVAGAPVILAHPIVYPQRGIATAQTTLNADLSTPAVRLVGTDGHEFDLQGAFAPGDDGFTGSLRLNLADANTDVPMDATGTLALCASGLADAPHLVVAPALFAPTQPIWFAPSAPIDATTLSFVLNTDLGEVPVDTTFDRGAIRIRPRAAFPPNQRLQLGSFMVIDVLGRSATVDSVPSPMATTAVVTDLAFDTAPPSGAAWSDADTSVMSGTLVYRVSQGGPWSAVLAFAAPSAGATSVRVRYKVACVDPTAFSMSIVAGDGSATALDVQCDGASHDATGAIPGPGPLWLSIVDDLPLLEPQFLPPPRTTLTLDDVLFQ